MATSGFSIKIVAVDNASAQFEKINKAMARIHAPVRQLQASLQRFAAASGLSRVAKSMGDLGRAAFSAFQSLTRIVAPLGAITGAASAAGMYRLVSAWGEFGSQLRFSAQRIGIASDSLQSLQGAAMLAGSSSGALTSGLTNLQDVMTDALGGRNPEALLYLRTLGINFQSTGRQAKSVTAVLPQIADRIAAIKNPTLQARVATELFGGAAEDLLPFLREGSAGIARYTQMARNFGVINDAGTRGSRQLAEAQTEVELSVQGLGNSVAQVLAPVLVPMLHQLALWISHNRTLIAQKVTDFVKSFATWLKSIDWARVQKGVSDFAGGVNHVVDLFGGWKTAAEGLLVFMGGRWALGILAPIAKVSTALLRLVVLTAAAGGGALGKLAKGILARGLTGAALDAAALPLFGAGIGLTIGKTGIGKGDTLLRPSGPKAIEDMVRAIATKQGVDPNEAVAIMRTESGGDNSRISPAGAIGLFGLMPATAAMLGVDPSDPAQNAAGGIAYYKQLLTKFHGNRDAAEAAYNAGPNRDSIRSFAATGDMSRLPAETVHYISAVDATRSQMEYRPGAPVQPVKVQLELTHANKPPPGFKAKVKPTVGRAMADAADHGDYRYGY